MIEVYKSTNTNFDFNGDMVLKPSLCDLEVELNGMIEVTLEHPYDKLGRWKYIEEDNIIRVPYPGKKEGQLFYIYDKDKGMTGVKCKARHIFFDLASEVLVDCRPTNCNGEEALNKMLAGTGFIGHSDIVSINTAHYIRKHIANEALISDDENSFINKWGGELDVDNFNVYMNNRTGGEYGVTFKYGRDLINLNENSNIDSIITRIIPVGFNGITIPETYVESPLINKYRKVKTDVVKFDHIKVKESPEDEEGYDTLEEAQEALREAARELFNDGLDKLLYQLDLEVTKLENTLKYEDYKDILTTGLGDTVGVEHIDIGIDIKTRVIKFTYDCIKEKYKTITLGNYIENDIDKQNSVESTLDKITNADGTVNAVEVAGVLNAINVKMRAMKDIAQKQDVRALLCEDLDPESPTYGAMCYGTMGFMIASERTPDNRDWNWRTFGTGKGFFADLIVAGTMLADRIKSGMLMSMNEKTWINMDDGTFNFADVLKLIDGKLILTHTNGSEGISIDKGGIKVTTNSANNGMEEVAKIIATSFSKDRNQNGLSICTTGYGDYIQIGYQKEDGTIRAATYFVPVSIPSAAGLPYSDAGIYIYDPIFLKNSLNIKGSDVDHQLVNLSGNYLGIYGDNGLEFGYKSGTALKTRLKIHESPPSGTGDLFESYGNWNFKGYTLHNINIQNSNLTNNYANLDSRSAASVTALESCEEDTIRYIYKDIRSIGNKIILNIPNKYKGCNYRIIGVAKKGFGDYSITSEEDTRFTIETDRELIMNIEISIDISLLRKEFKTEEAPLSEEVNYEYENS
ncbi:hypothetical protein HCG75_04435 [Clostridium sp. K12(2020)]|uniref:phage tail spike protein n=1 Tax=unclassified Clostridium TaxID=2614128 RepID=UPI001C8BD600|nr:MULTISPECIES: phage tail spike protein [unclassified Clostridium]MBX9136679.1 hypothetical protein [Clostridium sp. K12(2020)]MBX9145292.1 hypothetical protein [Clostridium sp. K13]